MSAHPWLSETSPAPGRSTSDAALSDLKKRIARGNEETQKAARRLRAAREKQQLALWRKLGSALRRNHNHSCAHG
jgi:hypothetical protein